MRCNTAIPCKVLTWYLVANVNLINVTLKKWLNAAGVLIGMALKV